jgi:hypothetical protein
MAAVPNLSGPADGIALLGESVTSVVAVTGALVAGGRRANEDSACLHAVSLDEQPEVLASSAAELHEEVTAVAAVPDTAFFVAADTNQNEVVLYSAADLLPHRHIIACPSPVRAMAVSSSHLL